MASVRYIGAKFPDGTQQRALEFDTSNSHDQALLDVARLEVDESADVTV